MKNLFTLCLIMMGMVHLGVAQTCQPSACDPSVSVTGTLYTPTVIEINQTSSMSLDWAVGAGALGCTGIPIGAYRIQISFPINYSYNNDVVAAGWTPVFDVGNNTLNLTNSAGQANGASGTITLTVTGLNNTGGAIDLTSINIQLLPAFLGGCPGVFGNDISNDVAQGGIEVRDPTNVTGHIYEDLNANGTQDGGELDLAGVDVVVTDALAGVQTVTTDAAGNWTAQVPPGSTSADVDESTLPSALFLQTEGDDPTVVIAIVNVNVDGGTDGYFFGGSVTGHIYQDNNANFVQDGGDIDLAGVDVEVTDALAATQTVTTDAAGNWTAFILAAGIGAGSADVDNSTLPAGALQMEGTDPTPFTSINGANVDAGIDGYFIGTAVTGHVFEDLNANGIEDGAEVGFPGVDVVVTDFASTAQTVTTDAAGNWTAYVVADGVGTADVQDAIAPLTNHVLTTTGSDPNNFTAVAGTFVDGGTDGYFLGTIVYGHVFEDLNANGIEDGAEVGFPGVDVEVTDFASTAQTVTTNALGNWTAFVVADGLGTADVQDAIAPLTNHVLTTTGSDPSTFTALAGTTVTDPADDGYFLGTIVYGHVFEDLNANGIEDGAEVGFPGVDVEVTDFASTAQTVTTNALGNWTAFVVADGLGTADVQDAIAPLTNHVLTTTGSDPSTFTALAGTTVTDPADDGYFLGTIVYGHVFEDLNANGIEDGAEVGFPGVDVEVTDFASTAQTVTTNALGNWTAFVVADGLGTADVQDAIAPLTNHVLTTTGSDPSTFTALAGTTVTDPADDGYFLGTIVYGHVFEDLNANGIEDGAEVGFPGVDVEVTDFASTAQTVTTNALGNWTAFVVADGLGTADVQDAIAPLTNHVLTTTGSDPSTFTALAGTTVTDPADDGYFLGTIVYGHVFEDLNANGIEDGAEVGFPGVDVEVTDFASTAQTVTTNALGNWTAFVVADGLGTADVQDAIAPLTNHVLTTTGSDPSTFTALAGTTVTDPADDGYFLGTIVYGHVFEDLNANGIEDGAEVGFPGVDVEVTDFASTAQTVTTNALGNWTAFVVADGLGTADVQDAIAPLTNHVLTTTGSDPSTFTALAGTTVTDPADDGYFLGTIVYGHVFEDLNANGIEDGAEVGFPGVDVEVTDFASTAQTVTTNALGNWTAFVVADGLGTADVQDAIAPLTNHVLTTTGSDPSTFTALAGTTVTDPADDGYFLGTIVYGHVFEDLNANGIEDGAEVGFPGVDVEVTDFASTAQTVTTNALGNWTAFVVADGLGTADVQDAIAPLTNHVLTTTGSDPSTFTALAGTTVTDPADDGYFLGTIVYGHVFEDLNANGIEDGAEVGFPGVDVEVTDFASTAQTVTTNALGNWTAFVVADGLGTADVQDAIAPLTNHVLTTTGSDPSTFTALAGTTVTDPADDGYFLGTIVYGHVFEDLNANGIEDGAEVGFPGVDVEVTDFASTAQTVTTNALGNWTAFVAADGLGTADVQDAIAPLTNHVLTTTGSDPSTFTALAGTTVTDPADDGYFLGTIVYGHVFEDLNANGIEDGAEVGFPGVDVVVTDFATTAQTVTTNALGNWTAFVVCRRC